jgi:hypothetical protein
MQREKTSESFLRKERMTFILLNSTILISSRKLYLSSIIILQHDVEHEYLLIIQNESLQTSAVTYIFDQVEMNIKIQKFTCSRDCEYSYTKLSCSVPMSGVPGNLLSKRRGDCADLQDWSNNCEQQYKRNAA